MESKYKTIHFYLRKTPVVRVKVDYFYALSNFVTLERDFSGTIDLEKTHKE